MIRYWKKKIERGLEESKTGKIRALEEIFGEILNLEGKKKRRIRKIFENYTGIRFLK